MNCIKISAVIITLNEEKNIQGCIDSVKDVVDEIIIVDSFSTDKTEEICRNSGVIFFQNGWEGYGQQKNWGNSHASYDYILSLDADERLSDGLKNTICDIKKNWQYDIYSFNRLWYFHGQKLKYSFYPDRQLRLFDRRKTQWNDKMIHESIITGKGITVKHIHRDIIHFSYKNSHEQTETLNYYSTLSAMYYIKLGKKSNFFKLIFSPPFSFIKNYFVKLGFLDGFAGLAICLNFAHYTYLKYAKHIELYKETVSKVANR
jgi:glycosyltransferase involved in cell wall biosynthesis